MKSFTCILTLIGSANAASLRGSGPSKVLNIGDIFVGIDALTFSTFEISGRRQAIFDGSYEDSQETADGVFMVPDGLTMTRSQACSAFGSTTEITGETSLMAKETTEVTFKASGGFGVVSGTMQNSNKFTSMSEETTKMHNVLTTTEMTCQIYQVQLQQYNLPHISKNFLYGLLAIRDSDDASDEALTFVRSFGTHYQMGVSMGSKYQQTMKMTEEQARLVVSSGVDIKVAASASVLGQTAGTDVLNEKLKEESKYFNSMSVHYDSASIGVMMPTGNTIEEIQTNWIANTETSTGLAAIGDFRFERIDSLLSKKHLSLINRDLAHHKIDGVQLTGDELQTMQSVLTSTINSYCEKVDMGYKCGAIEPDNGMPEPIQVDTEPVAPVSGSSEGGSPFTVGAYDDLKDLYGLEHGTINFDIVPTKVNVWITSFRDDKIIYGMEVVYTDGMGRVKAGKRIGDANSETPDCVIDIPKGERVTRVDINSGRWIDSITLSTDKTQLKRCGGSGGKRVPYEFVTIDGKKQEYFMGFTGKDGKQIDSIQPMKAIAQIKK